VPGSRIPVGVIPATGDRIDRLVLEAHTELVTIGRKLAAARPHMAPVINRLAACADEEAGVVLLCKLYERRLTSIATLDWSGEFVDDIRTLEAKLRAVTMTTIPGWYAGACRSCSSPTYVVPGLTWVTCRHCGTTTHASAHLDVILDEAADWIAPPRQIAEAVVVLVDSEHSIDRLYERIRKWGLREQLDAIRAIDAEGDPVGPKRYRLGDVLTRLRTEGATRLVKRTFHPKKTAS
jgi:hypothetical protein